MSSRRKQKLKRRKPLSMEQLERRELLAVNVTVNPFDHQQEFIGGGSGYGLYAGHLVNGVPAGQREEVYDWLFEDLNTAVIRMLSFQGETAGNDNSDPFDLDLAAMNIPFQSAEYTVYQEAIARDPDLLVMSYTNTHPDFLKNPDGTYNTSLPNFYEELAEFWYGNMAYMKLNYGIQLDVLDVLNEPDFKSELSLSLSTDMLANSVTALENLVNLHYPTYGVEMPLVSGFSNGTAQAGNNWLTGLQGNSQEAWDNLDILTTHPYGGGGSGFNQANYQAIAELKDADHPLFIQNEMEFGHSSFLNNSNALPDDLADDELEAALALARIFSMSVEAGADGFHVFQGNNPNSQGGKSLVFSPWGQTAVRRTGYFVYHQLTSLQPEGSDVVSDTTTGAPEGVHTLAYNKWSDNQVFLTITNATGTSEQANLEFQDNAGNLLTFNHVKQYATSGTQHSAVVVDQAVTPSTNQWTATIPANSVQTFVVTLNTTGYSIPVGDMTYLRERTFNNLSTTPQDGDVEPRTEVLIGLNGNGAAGSGRGEMRALMEFDLSSLNLPPTQTIDSARLEILAYRGDVDPAEEIAFDLHSYSSDFVESLATWVDPDGDGNTATGDTTQGGTLGTLLGTSSTLDGDVDDYDANGTTELLHERVVVDGNTDFTNAAVSAQGGDLRLILKPNMTITTGSDFLGFFDEDSSYAPELIVTATETDFASPSISNTVFNSETNQSLDFTFDEDIDTSTLQVTDFSFENLDTSQILTGSSDLFLVGVTSTTASILFRDLPLTDGNWELTIPAGAFNDLAGNSSTPHNYQFSVLAGDADSNGDVNGLDFLAWQAGFGTLSPDGRTSLGDFDHDLDVDGSDLTYWTNNYGTVTSSSTTAVETASASASTYPAFDLAKFQKTTASSSDGNTTPGEATDGIVSNDSRWYSNAGAGGHWLEVELTTPYPVGSAQLFLGKDDDLTVASFDIQYHDGLSWQTITSVAGNAASDLNLIFPAPIETATRYRFYTTENVARIKEFVLLPPNGGAGHPLGTDVNLNLASQRAPIASSTYQSNHAINAVDGWVDDNSRWLAPNSTGPHTLDIEIPSIHEVGSIHLYSGYESGGSTLSPLANFDIEYANGSGWTPIPGGTVSSGTLTGNSVTGNTSPEVVVTFSSPVEANKIRITFNSAYGRIRELVVLPANVTNTGPVGYPIGTSVTVAPDPPTKYQDYGDDWYRIAARSNNNSLITDESGSSQADSSTTDREKRFQLLYSYVLDAYRIRNQDTGKTIEVENASLDAGAAIVEGDYSAAPHQLWRLEPTDGGYFQIVNVWSGMALETNDSSPASVTQQVLDTSSNPANSQEWQPLFQDNYFKKGTGGWTGSFGTGWAYDWARNDPNPSNPDYFYVPMQHREGWPNLGTLHKKYADWNNDERPALLLGFNEPDRPDQANMSVTRAIELWPQLMAMDVPLVSPAPALGGEDWWLNDFMDRADNRGYRVNYAGGHWYAGPSVDNLFAHINDLQNKANGRKVWLTEFSVVDWSGGSGNWSEETNYNFILEFLWRAEAKNNLDKYAIFIFTGNGPTNPWDMTNPRSNFRYNNGSLTPFGKAYAAWDGDKTIHDYHSYLIHNRNARHRLKNDGSSALSQDTIRTEDVSLQWFFEDAGGGKKYITSTLDGKRLRYDGTTLDFAPEGTSGTEVEWTIQQEQYGWHNIIHTATNEYLRLVRVNNFNNAPTSLTYEMVSAGAASGYTSTDWWFVRPNNAVDPPDTSGPEVSSATFNSNTNQSFDFTFSDPIDTSTLETSDFVFRNLDQGSLLTGGDLFLSNVTTTSATVLFRDLPLVNGQWELTIASGSFADSSGAGNPGFTTSFSVLNGDADFDGFITGLDFLAWQRGFGTSSPHGTASIGDADHDLDVDFADLAIWQAGYGSSSELSAAVVTDEPNSLPAIIAISTDEDLPVQVDSSATPIGAVVLLPGMEESELLEGVEEVKQQDVDVVVFDTYLERFDSAPAVNSDKRSENALVSYLDIDEDTLDESKVDTAFEELSSAQLRFKIAN